MDKKEKVLSDFYNYLKKEKSYSNHTIKAYKNDLSRFLVFLPKKIFLVFVIILILKWLNQSLRE